MLWLLYRCSIEGSLYELCYQFFWKKGLGFKGLELTDYIKNINKQRTDVDAVYKHISRSEVSNIDITTVGNVIDASLT